MTLPHELGPIEIRVLGALIEKQLSTPDHYPLSLNALVAACNQTTNREPVMTLDSATVSGAIDVLRRQSLVRSFQGSGERVPKFQHLVAEACELSSAEVAVLCVLMLRGPQTLAEVRTRAGRLLPSDEPDGIEAALEALIARAPSPAAVRMPRRPGQKEVRYAHLLGGEPISYDEGDSAPAQPSSAAPDRVAALEEQMEQLLAAQGELRAEFAAFRKQFE